MYAHARALSRSFSRRRQLISKLISQPVPRQSSCSFALLHTRLHEHLYFNRKTPSRPLYRLVSRCRGHESSCQPAATSRPPRVSVFALLIGRWRRWWRDLAAVCPSRWPLVSPSARPNEGGVGAGGVPFFFGGTREGARYKVSRRRRHRVREHPTKGETAKDHFDVMGVMTSNSVQSVQAGLISARVMQSYSTLK